MENKQWLSFEDVDGDRLDIPTEYLRAFAGGTSGYFVSFEIGALPVKAYEISVDTYEKLRKEVRIIPW